MLICLTFLISVSYIASANDAQCSSFHIKNITDQTQSSVVVALLNNAKSLLDDAKKYAAMKTRCPATETKCDKPIDCAEIMGKNASASSGVYKIWPRSRVINGATDVYCDMETKCDKPMDCAEIMEKNASASSGVYKIWPRSRVINGATDVYCDMEDDGGAWTLLQRRGDFDSGRDYFYKDWQSYKIGFGDRNKDFWLGNDNIFALTNQRSNVVKFTLTDWEKNNTYVTFDEFWIDDESRKYTMHVNGYKGTTGDSFSDTNGLFFSTKDRDNDDYSSNCAVEFKGAWWYSKCHNSNLNGLYLKGAHESHADGVEWYTFRGYYYSLKDTVIKIRPKNFQRNPDDITPL